MGKTVLITGCSSGFGKLSAKRFQQEGWNVIATMRSPEKEQELNGLENLLVTRLDVTDISTVKEAVRQGIEKFGTIDVLVNNAGYGGHSLFEQFSEEQIYKMYETNVFGLMRVSREVLPHMRKQKEGTIINVTSMAGIVGTPFASTYSSTKFAVEGLSEGMALEYKPFNIKVKTVAPGFFRTNFTASTDDSIDKGDEELKIYAQQLANFFDGLIEQMSNLGGKEANPQDVADKIYDCATKEVPVHNIVGADAEMLNQMKTSMPGQGFLNKLEELLSPKN